MLPLLFKNSTLNVALILVGLVLVSEAQNGVGVNTNTPKSSFEDNGSFGKKVTTIFASTPLDDTYASIICNNGAVAIAVTLPAASTCAARVYEIKRNAASTANVTVTATIDGVVNYVLTQAGQSITVFSDGTNWLKRDGQGGEWSINGNSGTVAGTNFLGTTDAIDFVLKTSGTERLRVLSAGNIGINETAPSTKLHVTLNSSTASTMPVILQNNGGSTNPGGTEVVLRLSPSSSETIRGADIAALNTGANAIDMKFLTCNNNIPTEKVRITSLGNVGIGTATPTEYLHISSNTAPFVLLESNGGSGKTMAFKIRPWNGMPANTYVGFGAIDDGLGGARAAIFVPNAASTGVTEAVSILKSSGNVGIGTAAPTEYLHIFNNTAPFVLLESNGGGGKTMAFKIRPSNLMAGGTYAGFGGIDNGLSSARAAIFVPNAANNGVAEAVTVLNSSGNVGIGTTVPTEYLHIFNNTAPFVLLESNGTVGKIMAYKLRTWNGMPANTYVGFGGVDDGLGGARATIFVPNAANTGVAEAVSILKSSGNVGIGTINPLSVLEVNGSFAANITTATTSPILNETHHIISVTAGTVTLPAVIAAAKRIYYIANKTGGAITIGNYLNLSNATVNTVPAISSVSLVSDGINWIQFR